MRELRLAAYFYVGTADRSGSASPTKARHGAVAWSSATRAGPHVAVAPGDDPGPALRHRACAEFVRNFRTLWSPVRQTAAPDLRVLADLRIWVMLAAFQDSTRAFPAGNPSLATPV